ncbi:MAG: protein translocase subunit SecD [Planctomycetota bacterium]|jgi:SecD/SecF fusion protein
MDKNLIWKTIFIAVLVVLFAVYLNPPQEKLKAGIDLAGGTSLIYELDTTGLSTDEQKNLAQDMIPTLLKRIDPTNVANIVMRPQGNTRIEIQLPVASKGAKVKRDTYEAELDALEDENINLLKIQQTLKLPADQRQVKIEEFARGNDTRKQILDTLASVYDLRSKAQADRDEIAGKMEALQEKFEEAGLEFNNFQSSLPGWAKQSVSDRKEAVESYVKAKVEEAAEEGDKLGVKQIAAVTLINSYIDLYNKRGPIVDELTKPVEGLNDQWNAATKELAKLNLNIDLMREVMALKAESKTRIDKIEQFKTTFPTRTDKIDAVVKAYDEYRVVAGRLDDPEDLKRMLKGSGVLEFRILPTGEEGNISELQAYQTALAEKGPKLASDSRYVWCEIENPDTWSSNGITGQFGEKTYVLCSNQKNQTMLHSAEKEWKLQKARPTADEQGRRAIGFSFDNVAANMFFRLTSDNIDRPLCILLDDLAISAPNINSAISSQGIITGGRGGFSQLEVADMVNKLNAGSFRAKLSEVPISEKSISATLGEDNLKKGVKAGFIGLAAVAVFMLVYYMLSGAIADIALVLNILFVLGIMAMLQATFTLPGIAGLILTIGMSVDANVLIFERIREEQNRGSALKAAITNGYQRAFRTIFDANVTTFGVAAILYMAASEEIKGFAIVLMLGIVSSMFTALFVTRVVFDWLTGSRIITNRLAMFGVMQNVNVNWMSMRPMFMTVSSVLIIGGLGVFLTRDNTENSKYDIEFIGGTSVEIELIEAAGLDRAMVEDKINDYLSPVKVYEVGDTGLKFEIGTTVTNKSTALVTFKAGQHTPEEVVSTITVQAAKMGRELSNLKAVNTEGQVFEVSTSRVNAPLVRDVLEAAFAEVATVSGVEVHEVVNDAVREAFKDSLAVREDLGLTVVDTTRIEVGSEDAAILADYLGGIKIACQLKTKATATELAERIKDIRFKPDMQDLDWYNYTLLKSDLTQPEADEELDSFIFVSVHPEAGYRELEDNEWTSFINNETTKISSAASLETSLSRVTQIDPSIGAQAKQRAMVAIILSLIAIVGYIWIRFGTARYGFAAIAALVHDVCITLGVVTACTYIAPTALGKALLIGDFKINLEMIAAFLTIIGYSLNDTIVVFDRIRENRGKLSVLTPDMISTSINQTLSRTLLTSFTTFMVVLVMYIWGGSGLRGFTFAMLIGIIVGTYSSVAIAAPILLLGEKKVSSK